MAETIENEFHLKPTLIEGRGGIFDVRIDGDLIYSKHETGEFPEHELIVQRLHERLKPKKSPRPK